MASNAHHRLQELEIRVDEAATGIDRVDALVALSWYLRQVDPARALEEAEEALAQAVALGYPRGIAHARRNCGALLLLRADFEAAAIEYGAALEASRALEETALEASCLQGLALLRRRRTAYAEATALFLEALGRFQENGDAAGASQALHHLAALSIELGEFTEARGYLDEALRLSRESGDPEAGLLAQATRAELQREEGALEEAVAGYGQCLSRAETLGNRALRPHLLAGLCAAHLALGQVEEALQVNEEALILARELQDHQVEIDLLIRLGRICDELEMPEAVEAAFSRARELTETLGDQERLLAALYQSAAFHLRRGQNTRAQRELKRLLRLAERAGSRRWRVFALRDLAALLETRGDFEAALTCYKQFQALDREFQQAAREGAQAARIAQLRRDAEQQRLQNAKLRDEKARLEALAREQAELLELLERQAQTLERQAIEDPLTGLYNRRYVEDLLPREVARARRRRGALCIALADIDDFKKVNDRFTHEVGDQVLQMTAQLLRRNCRAGDTVARYGGEEFLLVLPDADVVEGKRVCERMREAVALHPWREMRARLSVTLSFGLAGLAEGMDARALLAEADRRLYEAKGAGKNRIRA